MEVNLTPELVDALEVYAAEIADSEAELQRMAEIEREQELVVKRSLAEAAMREQEIAEVLAEDHAKLECLRLTTAVLGATIVGPVAITQTWPNEWIPSRVKQAECIAETSWRLHRHKSVVILEIAREFYYETGGWDRPNYVSTADVWLYSNTLARPFNAKTNRHNSPKRLVTAPNFKPDSWLPLSDTLTVFNDALVRGRQ